MGSVEIDVVNSNLLDFNVAQNSKVTVNEDGTLTINGTGGFSLNIDKLQLKAGITYYQKVELISGSISGSNINNTFLSFAGSGAWISSVNFSQTILNEDTEKTSIWVNASAIFNNAVIKIWANTDKSDFVKHQFQTAIMPIQQEMLTGDYVADVEHHEWEKLVLDGNENWLYDSRHNRFYFTLINKPNTLFKDFALCTHYKNGDSETTNYEFNTGSTQIFIRDENYSSVSDWKTYLQTQNAAGSPVIIYYKLAEPLNLELTSEQKALRNQKLYTYKNITNISIDNELASIDVTYKKDLETMFNNIIKQMPSSTSDTAET